MAKGKDLTCVSYVIMPDGRSVSADELTTEEAAQWQRNMSERLGEGMSDYYTQHPEEFSNFTERRKYEKTVSQL